MGHVKMEAESEAMAPKTKASIPGATINWESRGGASLRGFGRNVALPIPCLQTLGLQNCEIIFFDCFQLPSL